MKRLGDLNESSLCSSRIPPVVFDFKVFCFLTYLASKKFEQIFKKRISLLYAIHANGVTGI